MHLLLADVQMPIGTPNGVAISRMARLRRHKLPIIYMTGFYDPARLRAVEPDIAVLSKPFTGQNLLRMIETALNPSDRMARGPRIVRVRSSPPGSVAAAFGATSTLTVGSVKDRAPPTCADQGGVGQGQVLGQGAAVAVDYSERRL